MEISLITPAGRASRSGNQKTAARCARIFRGLGHEVRVARAYDGADADLLVALHAWRSAASIERFHRLHPDSPIVVLLAGTDVYRFQQSDPETTRRSMEIATALVGLHDLVHRAIPDRFVAKVHVVHQSAEALPAPRRPHTRHFDVLVAGHLRDEKDPLRAAYAARTLPEASRIRIVHFGKALDRAWQRAANAEMKRNPRYRWLGEVPHWRVRRAYATARLFVLSSVMEGGANVISEAVVAGLPVIASDIEASIGLLGADYAGYHRARDTDDLREALWRAENDAGFLRT
ncbi:MAG TPA: selenoneine biosynthesis selenosugar synthase SenB, partial [Woeseiaceae bacterium]|nr:selenoneine biosynthesis selenosugar synthase SenB [Woeseiaceae bacterium]